LRASGSVADSGLSVNSSDPAQHIRHRLGFPFPTASRGDAPPVQAGGDFPQSLCASGLSVNAWRATA